MVGRAFRIRPKSRTQASVSGVRTLDRKPQQAEVINRAERLRKRKPASISVSVSVSEKKPLYAERASYAQKTRMEVRETMITIDWLQEQIETLTKRKDEAELRMVKTRNAAAAANREYNEALYAFNDLVILVNGLKDELEYMERKRQKEGT